MFRDLKVDHEWGILLSNLELFGALSVHTIQGEIVPNIFMPPLYPLFLYLIKIFINNIDTFLWTVQFTQLFISLVTIFLTYRILLEFFSKNLSTIGTLVFALFPMNVYAVSQISSITLQVFLLNVFLYSYFKLFKIINFPNITIFSIASGLLMLLRGEYFVFVILSLIYLYLKKKQLSKIIIIGLITLIVVSPYLYRNYNIFGVITITKSAGYNLLKGNHPRTKVEGVGMFGKIEKVIPEVKQKLIELKSKGPQEKYDLLQDQILMEQAIIFIKADPLRYFTLYLKKFFSFLFIDLNASYNNYYSLMHIIPKTIIAITSFIGIILALKFKISITNYVILFYFANIGLFSFFFILPRYSLSLLTVQIILSLYILKKMKPNF
tara:strand:+ start:245 stop:1384 length:1140 start_codon:yes stop_codon:yes gene_type:complete